MGYYMRYIVTDEKEISLAILESALQEFDSAYQIERDEPADDEGELTHDEDVYGQIEINRTGDAMFDGELEELMDFVNSAEGENKSRVLEVLNQAKAIIAVRVVNQGRESEATLTKIDPLWGWLFANRAGLMQAGGEGYYDASGLILPVAKG